MTRRTLKISALTLAVAIGGTLGMASALDPNDKKQPGTAPGNNPPPSTKPGKTPPPSPGQTPAKEAPAAKKLSVGDPAPKLTVDKWIKGTPVKELKTGTVYVVEFWATWCGPCIAGIPHLTELQKKHPEVVIIGLAGSERPSAEGQPDRRLETLENFVKGKGKQMDYRVAYEGKRVMSKDWMQAAGEGGIPCAFIVGADGKIAWIGHPTKMDEPLAAALKANKKVAGAN